MNNKAEKDRDVRVKLEACPFCGNQLLIIDYDGANWWVYCTGCGAEGPLVFSKEEAVGKWNKRLV